MFGVCVVVDKAVKTNSGADMSVVMTLSCECSRHVPLLPQALFMPITRYEVLALLQNTLSAPFPSLFFLLYLFSPSVSVSFQSTQLF